MSPMPRAYFERLYHHNPDPWGFATRWYEARKYGLTLAALPRARYRRAFEPGCSIGVLTEMLAGRCDALLAADVIPEAVVQAERRATGLANVQVRQLALPEDWPDATFDLIVLSEVAYYFDQPELEGMLDRGLESLESGGNLVAVHWRGPTDYPLSGDRTHEVIAARSGLAGRVHHVEEDFVLDVWERVAQ